MILQGVGRSAQGVTRRAWTVGCRAFIDQEARKIHPRLYALLATPNTLRYKNNYELKDETIIENTP